jgi:hypothetical protein
VSLHLTTDISRRASISVSIPDKGKAVTSGALSQPGAAGTRGNCALPTKDTLLQAECSTKSTEVGGCFFWEFPAQKSTFSCFVFRFSQDTPPQNDPTDLVVGQDTSEVLYPKDLSNGYETGPKYRKTASERVRGIGSKWPNMGLQHATYAWDGLLERYIGVYDFSGFHFCWLLRSKPSRSMDIPPTQPNSQLLQVRQVVKCPVRGRN